MKKYYITCAISKEPGIIRLRAKRGLKRSTYEAVPFETEVNYELLKNGMFDLVVKEGLDCLLKKGFYKPYKNNAKPNERKK